jgi:dTDP-4-dehydrorhamnose reductase
MNYSIICTGSSGLVADHFKKTCKAQNIPFHGLDLHGETESVDITNYQQLKLTIQKLSFDLKNPIFFHFAAITITGKKLTDDQIALSKKVNIKGTENIVNVTDAFKIPLVHISTDFVFSGTNQNSPFKINDKIKPDDTVYAQTKAEAENIVKNAKKRQLVCIMRIAYPYGNFSHPKLGLARKMLSWMDTKPEVSLYANQKICPTSISYISNACIKISDLITTKQTKNGQILHVAGHPTTPFKFGDLIKQIFQKETLINKTKLNEGNINLILDTKETEKLLDIKCPNHKQTLKKLHDQTN